MNSILLKRICLAIIAAIDEHDHVTNTAPVRVDPPATEPPPAREDAPEPAKKRGRKPAAAPVADAPDLPPQQPAAPEQPAKPAVPEGMAAVNEELVKLAQSRTDGVSVVMSVLREFKAARLSDIAPHEYDAVLARAREAFRAMP